MKNKLILLLAIVSFFGCKKEDQPLFRIVSEPMTITVDGAMSVFGVPHIFNREISTNVQSAINANGIDPDSIKYIRPTRARLDVIFKDGEMDFIEAMSIRVCDVGENIFTECGREAFWRDPAPANTRHDLNLNTSNVEDLSDFILEETINVQIIFEKLYWNPNNTFDIQVELEFGVW